MPATTLSSSSLLASKRTFDPHAAYGAVSASATSVAVGSQVTVTVALANTAPYAAWGSNVRFDASKLLLDSVVAGTQATYVADSRSLADIRASGDLRCGGYCLDGSGRATDAGGNASLARLTFTVTAVGSSQLTSPGWSGAVPFGDTLIARSGTSRTPASPSALTITGTSVVPPPPAATDDAESSSGKKCGLGSSLATWISALAVAALALRRRRLAE